MISRAISWGLSKSGLAAARRKASGLKAVILSYDKVLSPKDDIDHYPVDYAVQYAVFREHVRWLARLYDVIGLREFCRRFLTCKPFLRPTAILTFDNGYIETYDHVAPALEDHGLTGAVFLPTNLVGTFDRLFPQRAAEAAGGILSQREKLLTEFPDEGMPPECEFVVDLIVSAANERRFAQSFFDHLDDIPDDRREDVLRWFEQLGGVSERTEPAHLTWTHVKALHEDGWEIGTRGATGAACTGMEFSVVEAQLADSFRTVQEQTGQAPVGLCYPDGQHDEYIVRAAQRAGFLCAMTGDPGKADGASDLFALPRIKINQRNAPSARALETLLSFVK